MDLSYNVNEDYHTYTLKKMFSYSMYQSKEFFTKALELGCKDTHFVNANGIHDSDHYSTAYDLALIGRYALQFDTFREIVSTTKYTLPATNKYPEANRFFKQTNSSFEKPHVINFWNKAIGFSQVRAWDAKITHQVVSAFHHNHILSLV